MKQWGMLIVLVLYGISLLTACDSNKACGDHQPESSETTPISETETLQETIILSIVDGAESGELVLAGKESGSVYTFTIGDAAVFLDGKPADASQLKDGMMAEITFSGEVMESYPMRLGGVERISVHQIGTKENPGGYPYDLCGLYLQVLEDLWERDNSLDENAEYISVDLSDAPGHLTDAEKEAITWIFCSRHQKAGLSLSMEELEEQGYLSTWLEGNVEPGKTPLNWWENGVLYSIRENVAEETEPIPSADICFQADKWQSPLGAYFFHDCTASWTEAGSWKAYSVGGEGIA